jgi:hypothetical protein
MGVFSFLAAPKKGSASNQISELESSLAKLREERASVGAVVDSYGQRRADALLSDATDADIAKIDTDANLAQIRLERLELAELELVERIAAARDTDARQRRASAMDAAAAAIAAKTSAVDAAASGFAAAYRDLLATIPADLVDIRIRSPRHMQPVPATPAEIAGAIAGQALTVACPALFQDRAPQLRHWGSAVERVLTVHDVDNGGNLSPVLAGEHGQDAAISTADHAARRVILEPLRRVAEEIRAGKVAADAKQPAPKPATIEPAPSPTQRLVFLKPATYVGVNGQTVIEDATWETFVAEPVAQCAIELGIAVATNDPRAVEHLRRKNRRPEVDMQRQSHLTPEEPVDLGVNLKRIQDTERARLNQNLEAAE